MKPLLVGEDNPYQVDPVRSQRYALYPLPQNSAGGRLCALVMAMTIKEYVGKFDRANLCDGRWSMKKARLRATLLLHDRGRGSSADYGHGQHDVFVLCGSKVCDAFGVDYEPFTTKCIPTGPAREVFATILPHPSGRSRIWNDPRAFERARQALRDAGILPGGGGTLWTTPAGGPSPLEGLEIPPAADLDAIAKRVATGRKS